MVTDNPAKTIFLVKRSDGSYQTFTNRSAQKVKEVFGCSHNNHYLWDDISQLRQMAKLRGYKIMIQRKAAGS